MRGRIGGERHLEGLDEADNVYPLGLSPFHTDERLSRYAKAGGYTSADDPKYRYKSGGMSIVEISQLPALWHEDYYYKHEEERRWARDFIREELRYLFPLVLENYSDYYDPRARNFRAVGGGDSRVGPAAEYREAMLAAQGAALVADGLAGGAYRPLVERLRIREASGSVLDHLRHPAADRLRARFEEG